MVVPLAILRHAPSTFASRSAINHARFTLFFTGTSKLAGGGPASIPGDSQPEHSDLAVVSEKLFQLGEEVILLVSFLVGSARGVVIETRAGGPVRVMPIEHGMIDTKLHALGVTRVGQRLEQIFLELGILWRS